MCRGERRPPKVELQPGIAWFGRFGVLVSRGAEPETKMPRGVVLLVVVVVAVVVVELAGGVGWWVGGWIHVPTCNY